jgi:glutamyl-tRNA synthetase
MVEFDHLILKEKEEENDNIEDLVNPNSRVETTLLAEIAFNNVTHGEAIQFERRGYFYVDKVATEDTKAILHYIPDGRTKTMSVVSTKVDPKSLNQGKDDKKSKKLEEREKKKDKVKDKPLKEQSEEDKQKAREAIEKKKKEAEQKQNN